jgi:hypothetical protein
MDERVGATAGSKHRGGEIADETRRLALEGDGRAASRGGIPCGAFGQNDKPGFEWRVEKPAGLFLYRRARDLHARRLP